MQDITWSQIEVPLYCMKSNPNCIPAYMNDESGKDYTPFTTISLCWNTHLAQKCKKRKNNPSRAKIQTNIKHDWTSRSSRKSQNSFFIPRITLSTKQPPNDHRFWKHASPTLPLRLHSPPDPHPRHAPTQPRSRCFGQRAPWRSSFGILPIYWAEKSVFDILLIRIRYSKVPSKRHFRFRDRKSVV